ncbi:hypothetical protein [Persephonella sp.]|nr:hypothetical protein [Aquificota bacterium]
MKRVFQAVFFVFLSLSVYAQSEENKLLSAGAVKGNITDYLPEGLFQVSDALYYSYAAFGGSLHIMNKTEGYHDFYLKKEVEAIDGLLEKAREYCSKDKNNVAYGVDQLDSKITHIGNGGIMIVVTGNIVCLRLKK